MTGLRVSRRAAVLTIMVLGASLWTGCSDRSPDALTDPLAQRQLGLDRQDMQSVLAVHRRRSEELLRIPGVVGTAVGLLPNGKLSLRVLLARHGVTGLPSVLDGVPVIAQVTAMLVAFSDPTKRQRPAPMGFSFGDPATTVPCTRTSPSMTTPPSATPSSSRARMTGAPPLTRSRRFRHSRPSISRAARTRSTPRSRSPI